MKLTTISALLLAGAAGMGLWSCSADNLGVSEPDNGPALGETVRLTVAVSRDASAATRTALSEANDGADLACTWSAGDKLLVTDASGNVAGLLNLKEGQDLGETAIFDGEVTVASDNGKAKVNFLYLGTEWSKTATIENPDVTGNSITIYYSGEQPGTVEGLTTKDLLVKKGEEVTISGSKAYLAKTIAMDRLISFGKFKMKGVAATEAYTVSITGSNLHNKVLLNLASMAPAYSKDENTGLNVKADKDGVFYTVLLPTSDDDATNKKLETLTFTAKIGEKTFTGTYISEKGASIKRSRFYRSAASGTTTESFGPIEINMGTDNTEPMDDADLVGPVFEVNGKTFRFTHANLTYNMTTKEWKLLDEQYDYVEKAGFTDANGKWMSSTDKKGVPQTKVPNKDYEVIDLFGFGATGLYDEEAGFYARIPEYWIRSALGPNFQLSDENQYYPSSTDKVSDWQKNHNSANVYLRNGIQGTVYDWGTAYEATHNGNYFTLSYDDWKGLSSKYIMSPLQLTDVKDKDGNVVTGLLIFGKTDKTAALELIKKVGKDYVAEEGKYYVNESNFGKCKLTTSGSPIAAPNYNFDWLKLTKTQFKALESAGAIVFIPAFYHRAQNMMYSDKDKVKRGFYWTSTHSGTTNATALRLQDVKECGLYSTTGRMLGCAVRLVKEVEVPAAK